MRDALFLSALAFALLLSPTATAQVPAASLQEIRIEGPMAPVDPGVTLTLQVAAIRACPSTASVLAQQDVALVARGSDGNGTPAGVLSFAQHLCANGNLQPGEATASLLVPADAARNETLTLTIQFVPDALAPGETGLQHEVFVGFDVTTTPAPPAPAVVDEEPKRESPGVPVVFALAALAALAAATRRSP